MKAVVFHKPKDMRVETVEDPSLEDPRDAILRVTATAICGSDLRSQDVLQRRPARGRGLDSRGLWHAV
jgi:alcohol dehydrogenase